MSDNIPFEIQIEFMKRLPVKSLMQFRSVSKEWKSMIDSSPFVFDYNLRQTQPHLFIQYQDFGMKYVSFVDDDNFPEQKCDMTRIIPNSIKEMIARSKWMVRTLVGSSQGLLCFYDESRAVIWNPSIRKSVDVIIPKASVNYRPYGDVVGFGVCPKTSDPKFVRITFPLNTLETETWHVHVYSLSLGFWRVIKINKLFCESFELSVKMGNMLLEYSEPSSSNECVDGFIYWRAWYKDDSRFVIISFDLSNEEFGVINLPDSIARCINMDMSKNSSSESLVLLPYNDPTDDYDVWMMEGGTTTTKSFKKLFTINITDSCVTMMAFNYKGEAILEILEHSCEEYIATIDTYEPSSKRFKWTTISGNQGFASMSSYKETMLLHDYKDSDCYFDLTNRSCGLIY